LLSFKTVYLIILKMEGLFTSSEKELLIRALRALAFFLIAVVLARNVTQVDLPIFQLSLVLALMSCFKPMLTTVHLTIVILLLQVLFPSRFIVATIEQIKRLVSS
jgi:hypothetical protein